LPSLVQVHDPRFPREGAGLWIARAAAHPGTLLTDTNEIFRLTSRATIARACRSQRAHDTPRDAIQHELSAADPSGSAAAMRALAASS